MPELNKNATAIASIVLSLLALSSVIVVNLESTNPINESWEMYINPSTSYYEGKAPNGTIVASSDNASYILNTIKGSNRHIRVLEGTYPLSIYQVAIATASSGLTIEGQGTTTIFTSEFATAYSGVFYFTSNTQNVTLKNFVLRGGNASFATGSVYGIRLYGTGIRGITLDGLTLESFNSGVFSNPYREGSTNIIDFTVKNCNFFNFSYYALQLWSTTRCRILENNVSKTGYSSILVCGASPHVIGNSISDLGFTQDYGAGVHIANPDNGTATTDFIVANNYITLTSAPAYDVNGILISGETGNAYTETYNGVVTGNVITGLYNNSNCIAGIYLHHGTKFAYNVRDVAISGNVVSNMTYGIVALGKNQTITGNKVTCVAVGIWSDYTGGKVITSNRLDGIDNTASTNTGIVLSSPDNLVGFNHINGFALGISEYRATYTNGTRNLILGNFIRDCPTTVFLSSGSSTNSTNNYEP